MAWTVDAQLELNATEAVAAIQSGRLKATDYVATLLARAAALSSLNALTSLNMEGALADARRIDALPPDARARLPLAGLPVAVKNNINTISLETSASTPALEDFVPKTFNSQLVDDWVRVSDTESFYIARQLSRREGILAGGSSGTAVAAALRYAQRLGAEHLVVALCADTGRNYLSKFFDDDWLAANKLVIKQQPAHSIGDLLRHRGPRPLQIA